MASIPIKLVRAVVEALLAQAKTVLHVGAVEVTVSSVDGDWQLAYPAFPGNKLMLMRIRGDSLEWQELPLEVKGTVPAAEVARALSSLLP
jgi:hypothetical protein